MNFLRLQTLSRLGILLSCLFVVSACSSVISTATGDNGIEENPARRSIGTVMDDNSIETNINVNLNAADEALKKAHITVVSYDSKVLLVGQVPTQALKDLATEVATSTSRRIETVHNELEIAGNTSLLSRSSDGWITTKVKTAMLADSEVSGLKTKIITSNGTVFLMGRTSKAQADLAANLASRIKGVVKVVRAFEYTD
jgi:osmotically-inducible protein OsmY